MQASSPPISFHSITCFLARRMLCYTYRPFRSPPYVGAAQAVVFSENVLVLDDCDFRYSSAEVLVDATPEGRTIIRNSILGDMNCKSASGKAFL